jgi:pRiA4b ORF-3-like protein
LPTTPRPRPVALRIELLDIEPLIWRRVLVSNQWTFASLHGHLQWVLGWQDSHAHEFQVGPLIVAPDWWIAESAEYEDTAHYRDERRFSLTAAIKELGANGEFEYRYDMGDGWRHRIVLESTPTHWEKLKLPLPACVAGENACPPEDVGGPHGYREFLVNLVHRTREQHEDTARWIGGVFDPKGFDLNRINRDWRGAKGRRR